MSGKALQKWIHVGRIMLMEEKRISGSFVDLRLSLILGVLLLFCIICGTFAFFSFSFSTFLTFLILSAILFVGFLASVYLKTTVVITFGKNERVEVYGPLIRREISGKIFFTAGLQPTGGFPNILDLRLDIDSAGSKPLVLLERIPVGAIPPLLQVSNQRFLIPHDLLSDTSYPGSLAKMIAEIVEKEEKKS